MRTILFFAACMGTVVGLSTAACTINTVSSTDDAGTPPATTDDSGVATTNDAGVTTTVDAGPVGSLADGAVVGNGCSDTPTTNNTRETAAPFQLNTSLRTCIRSSTDVDFYSITVPASPAKGGYVIVRATDVDVTGDIDIEAFSALDNGKVVGNYAVQEGQSVFLYFAAKAGATFDIAVKHFSESDAPTGYTFTATYNAVPDQYAPNDTKATAVKIPANTAISGYYFSGYDVSSQPRDESWDSYFKVTLPVGPANIALTNTPADINADVRIYTPDGSEVARNYSTTEGSSVALAYAATVAGDYYVKVAPETIPNDSTGSTSNVPQWMTQAYSLTVSTTP